MSTDSLAEAERADAAAKAHHQAIVGSPPPGGTSMQPWNPQMVELLSGWIMVFTVIVLVLVTALLWRKDTDGHQTLKIFGLVLIVCMTALLLVVGYNKDQLTPVVGLFGAIVGYLLGKDAPIAKKDETPPGKQP